MKSLAVSVFWPTWEWLTNPSLRYVMASYALALSIRDNLKARRLIKSPWYQRRWGHRFQLTGDQNAKIRYETDKTGFRFATSVGGAVTGEGGDRIIVDDPHNVMEAHSDAIREATLEWWDQVMSTRLNDPKTGVQVVIMQRVHERDLAGHILAQGGWHHLCLPAEYEPRVQVEGGLEAAPAPAARPQPHDACPIAADPRREPGELLWPARYGAAELAELKTRLGSYGAAGQLQQRPSPATGGIFLRHWWRFYTKLPDLFDEMIQSWDCAFKDLKASDRVAGHVWGRLGADCYLIDRVSTQLSFTQTVDAVVTMTKKWPKAMAKLVEDKANGPAVIDTLKHKIPGLIPIEPEGGKLDRAHAVSPMMEAGNVYLPSPQLAPWVQEFIEICAAFPFGATDDDVDAMTQALRRLGRHQAYDYRSVAKRAGLGSPEGDDDGRRGFRPRGAY